MEKLKDFALVVEQASRGELSFPTSVNAALQLQTALADPDCHIDAIVRQVLSEPLLAARTVALANSAVFMRHGALVTSARAAVLRIGYRNLYSLVAAMVVRQFGSRIRDAGLRDKATQLWAHTAHVAALAYVIARQVTNVDPDTALFAGIVHEVGGFYLLARADEIPGLLDDPADWMGAAEEIVTRALMNRLSIPEPVSLAVQSLRGAALTIPPAGLRDTLLLAKRLAPVPTPMWQDRSETPGLSATLTAYLKENDVLDAILAASAEEARSMSAALLV
jgi:hypothetical protein